MICKVKTLGDFSKEIRIIPCGTIGWLKTTDNTIHQCKCIGAKWVSPSNYDFDKAIPLYEWKVAALPQHIFTFGSYVPSKHDIVYELFSKEPQIHINNGVNGCIFTTREYANNGKVSKGVEGSVKASEKIDLTSVMKKAYGFDELSCYVDREYISIRPYSIEKDNSVKQNRYDLTRFELIMDENGLHMIVPSILNGTCYATKEVAIANTKQLTTFTFDDDEIANEDDMYFEYTFRVNRVNEKFFEALKELLER